MNRLINRIMSFTKDEYLSSTKFNIIRICIATVIFLFSVIIHLPGFLKGLLLIISLIVSGYDIALYSVNSVQRKVYISEPVIILFAVVIAFVLGYWSDAAASVILYQIGHLLFDYTADKTKQSAQELAQYQTKETQSTLWENINKDDAGDMDVEYTMASSVNPILKAAMVISLLYAILVPVITSISFRVSCHRALMILLISIPSSLTMSIPLTGIIGMGYAAQRGVIVKNSSVIEKFLAIKTAIIDKEGIFTTETPRVISVDSDVIDKKTFINLASHAVYYSEQPFAKAISQYHNGDLNLLNVISNFTDITGYGVEIQVNGMEIVLASAEYYKDKDVQLPENDIEDGIPYYMTISGRYVGSIVVSEEINNGSRTVIENFRSCGVKKCVLLTEDSKSQAEKLADDLDVDAYFAECSTEKKLAIIADAAEKSNHSIMYVYSDGVENHTEAALDCRIGNRSKIADLVVAPEFINNLPFLQHIASRVRYVAIENCIFAFVIKAILIFLAFNGFTTMWFAVFMDAVAALATVLNCIRVTSESFITSLKARKE